MINSVRLRSGEMIDPMGYQKFYPEEMLNLNRVYRFGAKVDWTVADHLRMGSLMCSSDLQRSMWMVHESFEALTGLDVTKPIKHTWPWYVEAEKKYLEFVYKFLGLDFSLYDEIVSDIDNKCFLIEEAHFFKKEPQIFIELVRQYSWIPLDEHIMRQFPEIYGQME
jgi:hypothetical protein